MSSNKNNTHVVYDRHQDLLDRFAIAMLPTAYSKAIASEVVQYSNWRESVAIDSYAMVQAMVNERSRLIALQRDCEVKQRLGINNCSECPERSKCNK